MMITKESSLLSPLLKPTDKTIFGIEEVKEVGKKYEFTECDDEEEFDVQRSIN